MPTLFPMSKGGDSSGGDNGGDDIDSVRELNRLLESALRMGGQDGAGNAIDAASAAAAAPSMPFGRGGSSHAESSALFGAAAASGRAAYDTTVDQGGNYSSSDQAASWRLETARQLSSLLTSPQNSNPGYLLPVLRRQSRYWTPLLLSWLKSGGGNEPLDTDNSSLDLPLTAKQRRNRQKNNSSSSASKEVQIESLRALYALTEWTKHGGGYGSSYGEQGGGFSEDNLSGYCSPHSPLSTSSQRLLLLHSDAVPMIVSLLSSRDAAVREQAVWMLGSLASSGLGGGTLPPATEAAREVTKMFSENSGAELDGSMSVAVPSASSHPSELAQTDDLLSSSKDSRGSKKDSVSARDVIFAAGALGPLLKCLADHPNNIPLHRVGAWCLSSLVEGRYSTSSSSSSNNDGGGTSSSGRKSLPEEVDVLALLPTMRRLLHVDDAEVLTFTCWTLSHLCDGPSYHIAAVIYSDAGLGGGARKMSPANGLVPRLVELLLHPSPKVAKPALRTIGNIVCADCTDQRDRGDDGRSGADFPAVDFTEIILECDAVPCLRRLVGHHNREIQKEACWTLSNIAAGTASQIQAVIDSGAIRPLVDLVNDDITDKEVRSEACWVVLNATSCGNDAQISVLIEEGCVSVLGVLLTEPNMVMMALEGIERVLQTEEARDSEDLYHASEEELGQRPTIMRCASLIKTVVAGGGSHHNASSAVSKRARRIWDHHFVSCALCHNNYSRCRPRDSHFCNECKCHVCHKCDCRVYHLSYQEELWKEDEEKDKERGRAKKSKKAKKRQKAKEKQREIAEKKKADQESREAQLQAQQQQQEQQLPKVVASSKQGTAMASSEAAPVKGQGNPPSKTTKSKRNMSGCFAAREASEQLPKRCGANKETSSRKSSESTSPSRNTIESGDTTADSLLGSGAGVTSENEKGQESRTGESSEASSSLGGSGHNGGQPPIDLVLYLQQTGSIIALAKLMDSLYDEEYEDEDGGGEDGEKDVSGGGGRRQQQRRQAPGGRDLKHRAMTTQ